MFKKKLVCWETICVFFTFMFISCASSGASQRTDDFLQDFEPVPLENVRAQRKTDLGMKALELELYFIPSDSLIEIHFTFDAVSCFFLLNKDDRNVLNNQADRFFDKKNYPILDSVQLPSREDLEPLRMYSTEKEGKRYFVVGSNIEIYFSSAQLELFLAAIDEELLEDISDSLQSDDSMSLGIF